MKCEQFSEEQIIKILKEYRMRRGRGRLDPQAQHLSRDLLPLEVQVRWHSCQPLRSADPDSE